MIIWLRRNNIDDLPKNRDEVFITSSLFVSTVKPTALPAVVVHDFLK